jgi:hypothetical protein
MKKILILIFIIFFNSCKELPHNIIYTLDIELISGSIKRVSYTLPDNAIFFIYTDRGSYYLQYKIQNSSQFVYSNTCGVLKNAVVDYKIINKKRINIIKPEKLK